MSVSVFKVVLVAVGVLLFSLAGGPTLAKDTAKNVEVFVDLDGDGFDDNESDVNKDGVPDLVVPVKTPAILASASVLFGGQSTDRPGCAGRTWTEPK